MRPAARVELGYFLLVWEFTSLRMKPQVHTLTSPPVPNYTFSPDLFLLPVLAPPEAPKPVQFWNPDTALCSAATGNPSPRPVVHPPRHPGLQSRPPPSTAWPLNATLPWSPKSSHFPSVRALQPVARAIESCLSSTLVPKLKPLQEVLHWSLKEDWTPYGGL